MLFSLDGLAEARTHHIRGCRSGGNSRAFSCLSHFSQWPHVLYSNTFPALIFLKYNTLCKQQKAHEFPQPRRSLISILHLPILRRVGTGGGAVRGGIGGRCWARNCVWVLVGAAGEPWLFRGLLGSGVEARLDSELATSLSSSARYKKRDFVTFLQ